MDWRWLLTALLAVIGCGEPPAVMHDAAVGSAAAEVTLIAPNGGETLIAGEPTQIEWSATDPQATTAAFEIALIDANGGSTVIASTSAPANETTTVPWSPVGVASPTPYRLRITMRTDAGSEATDMSDAEITVSPPTTGVSLAVHLQPILTERCAIKFCHGAQWQVATLNLSAGASHAALVGVQAIQNPCTGYQRVRAGTPDASYLIFKLQGSGPCFGGVRMPKDGAALTGTEISRFRDWIAAGAKNN